MREASGLFALALLSAIASNAAWLIYAVSSGAQPPAPELADTAGQVAALTAGRGVSLTYGWSGTFGALLTIPYFFAMVWACDALGPQRWLAFMTGMVGAFMTALAFMAVSLSPVYFALPIVQASPDAAAAGVVALKIAQSSFDAPWFIGSFLAYGLATFWIALGLLKSRIGPAWLQWLGMAGGVVGLIWLRHFVPVLMPVAALGSIINIVLIIIWSLGTSLILWRRAT